MAQGHVGPVLRHVRRLAGTAVADFTDAQLLGRFVAQRDGDAFASLVERHGRLVWGVCWQVLRRHHDAEDAFQATFLVLARRAASIRKTEAVAGWLHRVAYHTATRLGERISRRRIQERQDASDRQENAHAELAWRELQEVLQQELGRLPEKVRAPFILCCLEGKSGAEAARALGWKEGTVTGRLTQARKRLRQALARRGIGLPAALCASVLAFEESALSAALVAETARAATSFAAEGEGTAAAANLARGVLAALPATRSKRGAVLAMLGLLVVGSGLAAVGFRPAATAQRPQGEKTPDPSGLKADAQNPAVDPYGDPLPPLAVARLGWRSEPNNRNHDRSPLAAFSSDGKRFAVADGPTVVLWDVATGKVLRRFRPASPHLHTLAFGPGNTLLCLAHGSVHVWDAVNGKEKRSFRVPETWDSAAFSRDGRLLAFGRHVWDVAGGKKLPLELPGVNADVSFSPDGRLVLVSWTDHKKDTAGTMTAQLRVHEVATGRLLRSHSQPGQALSYAVLSPDGKTVAAAGYTAHQRTSFIRLLDLETGKELHRFAEGNAPRLKPSFSPNGRFLTAVHAGEIGHVWEVATGKPVRRLVSNPGTGFDTLVFSADGTTLAGAGRNGRVHLWPLRGGPDRCLTPGHWAWVAAVAFAPDGRSLVSAAAGELLCWDLRRAAITSTFKLASPYPKVLVIAPGGRILLAGDRGRVDIYDLPQGQKSAAFKDGTVRCFSADGRALTWDGPPIAPFRCLPERRSPDATYTHTYALTPGGDLRIERLIKVNALELRRDWTGRDDYAGLRLVDSDSGMEIATFKRHPAGAGADPPVFSPDGKMMAGLVTTLHGPNRVLHVWETRSGQERLRLDTDAKDGAMLSFSPTGRLLAFTAQGGAVHLIDLTTGKEAGKPLPAAARCLAFSPNGKLLATGGEDTTILLWDVSRFVAAGGGRLTSGESDRLWDDLAAADGGRAFKAIQRLRTCSDAGVALLRDRLIRADLTREANRLLDELNSNRFRMRQEAATGLEALGDRARPFLRQALARPKLTLEQRRRVEDLLARLGKPFASPGGLRLLRSLEVLEGIGSPEAVALLRQLGSGPADDPLARESRRSLERLRRLPRQVGNLPPRKSKAR